MRLAHFQVFCDYLGLGYGHDEPQRRRLVRGDRQVEAAMFLSGAWAAHLAEQAGFAADTVWQEATAQGRRREGAAPLRRAA